MCSPRTAMYNGCRVGSDSQKKLGMSRILLAIEAHVSGGVKREDARVGAHIG